MQEAQAQRLARLVVLTLVGGGLGIVASAIVGVTDAEGYALVVGSTFVGAFVALARVPWRRLAGIALRVVAVLLGLLGILFSVNLFLLFTSFMWPVPYYPIDHSLFWYLGSLGAICIAFVASVRLLIGSSPWARPWSWRRDQALARQRELELQVETLRGRVRGLESRLLVPGSEDSAAARRERSLGP